jgi:hypothetical protein
VETAEGGSAFDERTSVMAIKRILVEHGVEPAPKRGKTMPWQTFLKAHLGVIAATDFFTVEVLTLGGLVRYLVWFVIDLESRRVHDGVDGFLRGKRSIKSECLDKLVPLGERHLRTAISEFVEHHHLERNHQGVDNRLLIAVAAPANENANPAAPIARRERLGGHLDATTTAARRSLSQRGVRPGRQWSITTRVTARIRAWSHGPRSNRRTPQPRALAGGLSCSTRSATIDI